jgi:hypothetical protein
MERPKHSKDWCCVHQCKYDGWKRGKNTYMNDVELFTFPGKKRDPNSRKKWLGLSIVTVNDVLFTFMSGVLPQPEVMMPAVYVKLRDQ